MVTLPKKPYQKFYAYVCANVVNSRKRLKNSGIEIEVITNETSFLELTLLSKTSRVSLKLRENRVMEYDLENESLERTFKYIIGALPSFVNYHPELIPEELKSRLFHHSSPIPQSL